MAHITVLSNMNDDEVFTFAQKIRAPYDLVAKIKQMRWLLVAHFAFDRIITPTDATLMMQSGFDGVFIGHEVFAWLNLLRMFGTLWRQARMLNHV
ncbi:Pyridoxal 5'-phosphate synthase-like subunit PDX1.2 [Bienertia sinuspersici]